MKLNDMDVEWPGGSGSWHQPRLVIISDDKRALGGRHSRPGTAVVATPLDLIVELDRDLDADSVVVLDGSYAGCRELALVLRDLFPQVRVFDGDPDTSPIVAPASYGIPLIAL